MAKKRELIAGMANGLGVPEGQVSLFYRALSEARLITHTGARGVNAPDMTTLDCARILIAMLVTDRPRSAPQAVVDFGLLPMTGILRATGGGKTAFEDGDGKTVAEVHIAAFLDELSLLPSEEAEKRAWLATIKCSPRVMQIQVWRHDGTTYFDDSGAFGTPEGQARLSRYFQKLDVMRAVIGPTISDIAAIFRGEGDGL